MALPTFTKEWHNASYAAINPTNPALSVAGKNVVVTGGGYGIGAATAKAFAQAGADHIVITGRKSGPLVDTKADIEKSTNAKVTVFVADVTDVAAINKAFETIHSSIGKIDILISNAGYLSKPTAFKDANVDDWWAGFEINVKGTLIVAQAFLKYCSDNATFIGLNTSLAHIGVYPGFSGYSASKTAAARTLDFMQGENPNVRVISVQPGVVATDMNKKSGITTMPYDDILLPCHFMVWAASSQADFLKGKLVWANWDVPELIARKEEIVNENKLTLVLAGWQ